MRGALALVLVVAFAAILASTILITYNAIEQTRESIENDLVANIETLTNSSPELRRSLAVYRAFAEGRNVRITRKAMTPVLAEIGILFLLALFVVYGVTRPANRLSKTVRSLDFSLPAQSLVIREEGSQEVRSLIRSFNGMIGRLKDYESVVGDLGRFKGWKEISRIIVHEVNNLVSPIETYASFLCEKLTAKDAEKASLILAKLGEIREILQKFRSMSHLPEPELISLDVVPLLKEVAGEFGKSIPIAGKPACVIPVDRVLFSEMIRNVVKNGVESSPEAAVMIEVETAAEATIIRIADDGPGIPGDILPKLFESGLTTKKTGLGIGLMIVKAIAREHKAAVSIDSHPGRGTVVEFRFPPAEGANT